MTTESINSKFGKIRQALGMDQAEFAKAIGVTAGYISQIKTDKKVPSEVLVELVRSKFDVSATWWDTGEGPVFNVKEEKTPPGSVKGVILQQIEDELDKMPTDGAKFELAADLWDFIRKRRG